MLKIESYHEHIVNLQGITYTWDLEKQNISEVTKIFIIKSVSVDVILQSLLIQLKLYCQNIVVSFVGVLLKRRS